MDILYRYISVVEEENIGVVICESRVYIVVKLPVMESIHKVVHQKLKKNSAVKILLVDYS